MKGFLRFTKRYLITTFLGFKVFVAKMESVQYEFRSTNSLRVSLFIIWYLV